MSDGYSQWFDGDEDHLLEEGYFYLVVSHRHDPKLSDSIESFFSSAAVEGLIAVDTPCEKGCFFRPSQSPGIMTLKGTNIALDHDRAANACLEHLVELGHRRIAFIKGQVFIPTPGALASDREAALRLD